MPKRIKVWDELRGVAILFMIFTHFFYYKSQATTYYHLNPTQLFNTISGPFEFFRGFINLHASYL
ncbi:MAG: hypothetical protein PF482_07175, partial [Desulfobacteraceae bacterium]|nr:hypothetical protein [Desulfobacteraceae bacterium]